MGKTEIKKAADVVPCHRCIDCIYFLPEHVETPNGEMKSYDEMPADAFDLIGTGLVTSEYGINVGSQCTVDDNCGYTDDKRVFRRSDDFCSRWRGTRAARGVFSGKN
nr:MAG TPA: hypothetical protein [Caudoviricetes sp.]